MQPVVIGDVMWEPSPEVISKSRLKRFMDQHGIESFAELLKRADDDIEWFWDAAIKDIDIAFYRPYDKVVDMSRGKPWATWWIGGRMNIVQSCLDRYRENDTHDKLAIVWEGEPGDVRKLTYAELDRHVCKLAGALRRLGIRPGDRVGIFMPMCPEVAISVLATVKIGAVIIPLFSGYGPEAIANRLRDGEAKLLICADGFYRRGQVVPMKETVDKALVSCPTVTRVIMHRRAVREVPGLGVSPTLVRGLMTHGDEVPAHHNLTSLRILGGTGEPWNPEPFQWFFKNIGGGRIPVINYTGGTEISGGILCGNVITHLRPCSFAGPVPGIAADVLDAEGRSVRGEVGELAIRNPWPGMTRGFWGDRERYLDTS